MRASDRGSRGRARGWVTPSACIARACIPCVRPVKAVRASSKSGDPAGFVAPGLGRCDKTLFNLGAATIGESSPETSRWHRKLVRAQRRFCIRRLLPFHVCRREGGFCRPSGFSFAAAGILAGSAGIGCLAGVLLQLCVSGESVPCLVVGHSGECSHRVAGGQILPDGRL